MYPDMQALLRRASLTGHTLLVILASGPRPIWENVLRRAVFLGGEMIILGGGRHYDQVIMHPTIKRSGIDIIRSSSYKVKIWAFGSGLTGREIRIAADHAVLGTDFQAWLLRSKDQRGGDLYCFDGRNSTTSCCL
ncbi:uracil phosphoribosyltransferase [Penicillium diatomitis]|uniref:Uracil phosphoribosyltransferase n=1 Tax=Penicillium diatomitis TaxID=2819901 RepID=A0A9X0BY01_9EURO|nr:uracil phosphoribosyltransferase [Penicillium diatomitis]KAJ5488863.1 uracil phosphoribosyltransferase [Penicillium diatomitis]